MKKLCAALLATGAFFATSAHADDCGGNLVEIKKAYSPGGTVVGQVQLYYNSDNGLNCATFKHSDANWGRELYTFINVYECLNKACTSIGTTTDYKADDGGFYKFFAGPVRQPGRGKCIRATGFINLDKSEKGSGRSSAYAQTAQHCG